MKRKNSVLQTCSLLLLVNTILQCEDLSAWVVRCPRCGSYNVIKKQNLRRKRKGQGRKYLCKDCGKFFNWDNNLKWTHCPTNIVGEILLLVATGNTFRKTARIISSSSSKQKISEKTVANIVAKSVDLMRRFERIVPLKLKKSKEWQIDEIFQARKKGDHLKVINVIDTGTRYILATHASEERDYHAAKEALKKALNNSIAPPKTLKCDGHIPYVKAARELMKGVRIDSKSKKEKFSHINIIEGMQNRMRGVITRRKRYKTVETLQDIADLFRFDHNFFWDKNGEPPIVHAGIKVSNLTWERLIKVVDLIVNDGI